MSDEKCRKCNQPTDLGRPYCYECYSDFAEDMGWVPSSNEDEDCEEEDPS